MITLLEVLVVQSNDPSVLLQLAAAANQDGAAATQAARLLHEEGDVVIFTQPDILMDASQPASFSFGNKFPAVSGSDASTSTVTFERVRHESFRLDASIDDVTGILVGDLTIDTREPVYDDAGKLTFAGDPPLDRSFVVELGAAATAQALRSDLLLVLSARSVTSPYVPPPSAPPLNARERRHLIDDLLGPGT